MTEAADEQELDRFFVEEARKWSSKDNFYDFAVQQLRIESEVLDQIKEENSKTSQFVFRGLIQWRQMFPGYVTIDHFHQLKQQYYGGNTLQIVSI